MALGDKFLEFLQTLWIFFSNLCIAILSYAFRVLWTVLTYLSEMLWNMFVAALIALKDYAATHPLMFTAIVVLAFIVVPVVLTALMSCFLHCLGFRKKGVLRGSYAAKYQSANFGGTVRRGSTFSQFQSRGAGRK